MIKITEREKPQEPAEVQEDLKKANEEQPKKAEKKEEEKKPEREPRPENEIRIYSTMKIAKKGQKTEFKKVPVEKFVNRAVELLLMEKHNEIKLVSIGTQANGMSIDVYEILRDRFFQEKLSADMKTGTHTFEGRRSNINSTALEITIRKD